ncbi:MAG: helix-turn-helix domain-containing protein [Coriobacteriia bacterium]|nr:helix-turn-helix domain-containing protein [Coriobacteriia bacterium]
MKKRNTYNHLDEESRGVIRDMLYSGATARQIANVLDVSHTTITREIKRNRIIKIPNPRNANASLYCKHFNTCAQKNICVKCSSPYTYCKKCRKIKCFKACIKFEYIECPNTNKWPFVCPGNCSKSSNCKFPKSSYAATRAQAKYKDKLISSRTGINMTIKELKQLTESIRPLINKGQSPYAVITALNKININVRTLYRYMKHGIMDIPAIELPRKIRYKKRKSKLAVKDKVDRTGRTYNDNLKLPARKRDKVLQVDFVEGYKWNRQTLLTLHSPKCKFQFINLLGSGQATGVVKLFDYYEELLGSRELFEKIFGTILADRGKEFDYFHLI